MEAPAIQPTSIADAILMLETQITNIRVKNTTMIGWYIHPSPTPSAIAAYEPRIDVLSKQVKEIDSIHVQNLTLLINDASSCVAHDLYMVASQLAIAIYGFQKIFIDHYDPSLGQGLPYLPIWESLEHLKHQLIAFVKFHRDENPFRRPAENLHPPPSIHVPTFCRSAIAFINREDRGRVMTCLTSELDNDSRARLKSHGGACFWWECQSCAFRVRVHVSNSATANINETDEIRSHPNINGLEYRSSWLAKSHLFHFGREEQIIERDRRRRSGIEQRRHSSSLPVNTYGVGGFKYGCILCFAAGQDLMTKGVCFPHAKDLASHLASKHGVDKLPPSLILEKFKIGVRGDVAKDVKRWDINVT